eukprot:tig00001024_g6323.t1
MFLDQHLGFDGAGPGRGRPTFLDGGAAARFLPFTARDADLAACLRAPGLGAPVAHAPAVFSEDDMLQNWLVFSALQYGGLGAQFEASDSKAELEAAGPGSRAATPAQWRSSVARSQSSPELLDLAVLPPASRLGERRALSSQSLSSLASASSAGRPAPLQGPDAPQPEGRTREEALQRYRLKRLRRLAGLAQPARYAVRKRHADSAPRIKGRFCSKAELAGAGAAAGAASRSATPELRGVPPPPPPVEFDASLLPPVD